MYMRVAIKLCATAWSRLNHIQRNSRAYRIYNQIGYTALSMVWFEKGFSIRALAHRGLGAASTLPCHSNQRCRSNTK